MSLTCALQAYRLLAEEMYAKGWDYPLHLGVTEVRALQVLLEASCLLVPRPRSMGLFSPDRASSPLSCMT